MSRYVIVGGGLAAASAIEGIRDLDKDGEITVVSAERELPYHRPPLSKGYLAGREQLETVRIHDALWYRDNRVRYRLGVEAKSVHMKKRSVTLASGERLEYDKLLLATGSHARPLPVPGADTPGVYLLRTMGDSTALKTVSASTKKMTAGSKPTTNQSPRKAKTSLFMRPRFQMSARGTKAVQGSSNAGRITM